MATAVIGQHGCAHRPEKADPVSLMLQSPDPDQRIEAIGILARELPPDVERILPTLKDDNEAVREESASALGWIVDQRAIEPLIEALADSSRIVRESAAKALGRTGDSRAVIPLIEALRDHDDFVVLAALAALEEIKGTDITLDPIIIETRWEGCVTHECHQGLVSTQFMHWPVVVDTCTTCHHEAELDQPSGSGEHFKPLFAQGENLCLDCHESYDQTPLYIHEPVADGMCVLCHDPHGSDHIYLLKNEEASLCFSCHSRIFNHLREVTIQHAPLRQEDCTYCHAPHGSQYRGLLKEPGGRLCFGCHTVMGYRIRNSDHIHRPVKEDKCAACHDPHGSNYTKLLKTFYPRSEWEEDQWRGYTRLCFDCHPRDIALVRETTSLTGFRNGSRNLHFVHVNQKKGRGCEVCHDAHASNQQMHLRPSVPFGKGGWFLPLQFTQTSTGGRCIVGCHREQSYDRGREVEH